MPKVSILVPIYNVERYLRQCLDSIVNQTLRDIEVICINDGSTDGSLSIILEYASRDARVKVVDKPNSGYGHSMNIGLGLATGDYIGIVESDDFADAGMFEKMFDAAQSNDAEVVMSNFYHFWGHSAAEEQFTENFKGSTYNRIISPMVERSLFFSMSAIWCGIYKRSFLANRGIRFLETPGASYQDTSFSFKVWTSAEKVYVVKDAFLHYRRDNMNSSVNSASKVFCICDEYAEIERYLEQYPAKKAELAPIAFAKKFIAYRWNYHRLLPAFQYAFLLKMAEQFKLADQQGIIDPQYLSDADYMEVYEVVNHPDSYFRRTSKELQDDRLMSDSTLNLQMYRQGFVDAVRQFKGAIIFGAGIIGKEIAQKLIEKENLNNLVCFAVSETSESQLHPLGIPVCALSELSDKAEDHVVLVAIKEQDQYEVINKLKALQFKNIVSVDFRLRSLL